MKRVLFICSLYHPHVGGIETMVTELAQFYGERGIASAVLTKKWPDTLGDYEEYKDIPIYRVVSARSEADFLGIIEWVKENEEKIRADVIHVIGMRRPLPLIGLLLSRRWNVPLISTIAGSEIPNVGDPATSATWEESKEIVKPVIEVSDAITCVSKALAEELHKVIDTGCTIRTIYAGIDVGFIRSVPRTEKYSNYIVSLRRLIPSKGVDALVRAFGEIVSDYPNLNLVIAGEGSEKPGLMKLAKDLGLELRTTFTGTVSLEEAVSLLKGAICTCVPSLSEGGSLVNVEAQAAGCPVIASRVGGIPEYVQDGISGLLFKPGDHKELAKCLRRLMSDSSLRNSLVKAGLAYADKFDWKVLGSEYLNLCEDVIAKGRSKPFTPWSELTEKLWVKLNA